MPETGKKIGKISILLILVIALCAGFVTAYAETEDEATDPPATEGSTDNMLMYVVVAVIVIGLIVAVIAIALSSNRKDETVHIDVNRHSPPPQLRQEPQRPIPRRPQPPPQPRPVYKPKEYVPTVHVTPIYPHGPVRIGVACHMGARESQQDSFVVSDISNQVLLNRKGFLAVVADGMGTFEEGTEISAIVTRTMLQYFEEVGTFVQPDNDLLNMLHCANDNVKQYLTGREQGGSTVVAVCIKGDKLYWISVGNSHIYLVRNGTLMQLNRDHTYAVELDEKAAAGEISWEEAKYHPRRAGLTSYLGIHEPAKIDRAPQPMQLLEGDIIILMTDGIFNNLSDVEILESLRYEPRESAAKLQEQTLSKRNRKQDNLTAVVIQYK